MTPAFVAVLLVAIQVAGFLLGGFAGAALQWFFMNRRQQIELDVAFDLGYADGYAHEEIDDPDELHS
jgi:hypothetical protein